MKTIVLAEKPSVGRELARVLKCNKKAKGFFEGSKYVVTWALGHLVTLAEPGDYDQRYKQWLMEYLPMMPEKLKLKVIGKTSHQFRQVTFLMKRNDISDLIIATDAGREGELVARWIMKLAGWRKPVKRLWVSSQTDQALLQGFANLKPGNDYINLFNAAVCRAEADWLIGLNVTRALTCKFDAQLTAGRVQTPTLAMIIEREKEIKNFKPVNFWTLSADFGDYSGMWRSDKGNFRLFDQQKARRIEEKVKGQSGEIISLTVKEKKEHPPLAYDLTELQRDANRRYGFSAQKTLSVLQGLYERHKLVTYPRTDSRYITHDIVPTLPQRLKSMAAGSYAALVKPLLEKKPTPGKSFVNDSRVTDHHAIIPTEQALNLTALDIDEKKLYDLIAKRFIAVLYPLYRYDRITIVTSVNGEKFVSQGKAVKEMGWRAVTVRPEIGAGAGEEALLPEQTLKQQKKGEKKQVKSCKIKNGKTQPPPRYNEATLLTAMESPGKFIEDEALRESIKQGGLGTPATRAEIIEKLLYNFYIERSGRELLPTSKGRQLIDLVPPALKSPELTAQWERRLSRIARGQESDKNFIADIRRNAKELVDSVKTDTSVYKAENITKTKCPMCNNFMLMVKGQKGNMLICSDRTCGHRQSDKDESHEYWSSERGRGKGRGRGKMEGRMGKKMIERFSDNKKKTGGSLGDLFEAALDKKGGGGNN
ncbi:MAG: DNA topoisomerase III [Candidatus Aminicenantes bacterium]|nr:DNA topoisomerase III [Candidatus Aminicenantes bacterium]